MDSSQTIDQFLQRCQDEIPGFSVAAHRTLGEAWVWEAMKLVRSTNLGVPKTVIVELQDGEGELPNDFIWLESSDIGDPFATLWRPGWSHLRYGCDGPVTICYRAVETDRDGFPLIAEIVEPGVRAWVYYKHTELEQRKKWIASSIPINIQMNMINKQEALDLLSDTRGQLNMRTQSEKRVDRAVRESRVYRNTRRRI